ncbi:MAG: SDR family NAD(P)-dependent oxidoreductase, partial [Acidobacteriota bacterium]
MKVRDGGPVELLKGRVAIVTGASKGIGRHLCQALAREGARVVCAARSADLVRETAAAVSAQGGEALAVVADLGQEQPVRTLIADTV